MKLGRQFMWGIIENKIGKGYRGYDRITDFI